MRQWSQARQGKKTVKFFDTDLLHLLDILNVGQPDQSAAGVGCKLHTSKPSQRPIRIVTGDGSSDISGVFANLHRDNDSSFLFVMVKAHLQRADSGGVT